MAGSGGYQPEIIKMKQNSDDLAPLNLQDQQTMCFCTQCGLPQDF